MSLVKKLLIKNGYRVTVVNAPADFGLPHEELPDEVEAAADLSGSFDFLLLFAHNQEEFNR